MTTSYFDRWWESVEADTSSQSLVWSRDRVGRGPPPTVTDEPDAFLHRPRGRWSIASHATTATRERLLLQAITARDSSAVLLLMRLLDEVPSAAMDALRKLARAGDHAVAAALLDRGDAVMTQTLVVPAGWANTQDRVRRRSIDCRPHAGLRSPSRSWISAHDGGRPPRLSGCTVVPGGAALLATASGRDDLKRARDWLQDKTATELDTLTDASPKTRSSSLRATSPSPPRSSSPTFATSRRTVSCR